MDIIDENIRKKCSIGQCEVYTGRNILQSIPTIVKTIFESGTILLIHDEGTIRYAEDMLVHFKNAGFRLIVKRSDDCEATYDFIRFVFGVGGGSVCDRVKAVSSSLDIDCAMLLTAPSTDTILQGYAPKQVFVDDDILKECPTECIAAGWGIVLSEPMRGFDEYFGKKVLALNSTFRDDEKKGRTMSICDDLTALAVKLLEISHEKKRVDTAEMMAHMLYDMAKKRGDKPRFVGEYKFLCSSCLNMFYSCFLAAPSIDIMPPSSHDERLDKICALTHMKRENLIKRIDFVDSNSYFRISYILSEYRMDLLERLGGIDLHATQRHWRRLYPDAGFWLKDAMTSRTMLQTLALCSEICGGLLGYAGATGFTERFLAS